MFLIVEAPIMLAASWFVCRWCVDRQAVIHLSGPVTLAKNAAPLMATVRALDLNIEFQKTIKQRRFPVEAASDEFGCRFLLISRFQKAEPP